MIFDGIGDKELYVGIFQKQLQLFISHTYCMSTLSHRIKKIVWTS